MRTYYDELELAKNASPEAVQALFGRLAAKASQNPSDPGGMSRLVDAFRVLSDPARRADYDRSLGIPPEERYSPSPGSRLAAANEQAHAGRNGTWGQPSNGGRSGLSANAPQQGTFDPLEQFLAKPAVARFVGPNFDKFALSWRVAFQKTGDLSKIESAPGWNWGAFWFGPFYLCYRKMWKWAGFCAGFYLIIGLLARISHTARCIGARILRKLFCENDLDQNHGWPRCTRTVARNSLSLHASKDVAWWPPLTAAR